MQHAELAFLLEGSPQDHYRRSAEAHRAILAGRWPAGACGLRHASAMARNWADEIAKLADLCDAEAESGRLHSAVATSLDQHDFPESVLESGHPLTLAAVEAGLLALAHSLGREHAVHVRRAMNGVLRAHTVGA